MSGINITPVCYNFSAIMGHKATPQQSSVCTSGEGVEDAQQIPTKITSITHSTSDTVSHLKTHMPAILQAIMCIENCGGEARIVGGTVRNLISDKRPTDFDMGSSLEPLQNIEALKPVAKHIIPTGIKHGTITVIIDNTTIEVTSLRKDIKCYGRSADVEFHANWYEDASRRDFTINAMSMDKNGTVYDYFDGVSDIAKCVVRFINDPKQRIKEDALRILRYFRFCTYLDSHATHTPSYEAVLTLAPSIGTLSGERIKAEMWKILSIPTALSTIRCMQRDHILQHIGLDLSHTTDEIFDSLAFMADEPIVNLAALLLANGANRHDVHLLSQRWRLSNAERRMLGILCSTEKSGIPNEYMNANLSDDQIMHKKLLFYAGYNTYSMLMKLHNVKTKNAHSTLITEILSQAQLLESTIPKCPINGYDMLRAGIRNVEVAAYLARLRRAWVESDFKLSRNDLILMCKNAPTTDL